MKKFIRKHWKILFITLTPTLATITVAIITSSNHQSLVNITITNKNEVYNQQCSIK